MALPPFEREQIEQSDGPATWHAINALRLELLNGLRRISVLASSSGTGGGGTGDVVGPAGATDNALARYDGVTGKLIQNGAVTESDAGRLQNVTDPTSAQDAATKAYVDAAAATAAAALAAAITALEALTFLTDANESATLPNSRRLLAGTNISFDDSVANQRTVSASASSVEFEPLTDGDLTQPELVFALGQVIMVAV